MGTPVSKTINVGKVMHDNTNMRISRDAVIEMKCYIEAQIEKYMSTLEMFAKDNKRLTIMSEDIVTMFSYKNFDDVYISKKSND